MATNVLSSSEASLKASIIIQTWYRRYKARLEARRRAAWVVYQSIEHSSEVSQMNLHRFFNDMLLLGSKNLGGGSESSFAQCLQQSDGGTKAEQELLNQTGFESVTVEKSYSGPHLTFPLSATQVQGMIEHFSKGVQLHARYLLQLLHEARLVLKARPSVYQASTSISRQVTVVGDLHGQLDDLLTVFYKNGLPDVMNPYVFNGDLVDRGANSIEVAALLFACQLVWPTAVCVNRGNHEDYVLNLRYGFEKEVQTKYQRNAKRISKLFSDVFAWLPLATVIDERIFVTHGGISDKLDLKLLGVLDRHRYFSIVKPTNSDDCKVDTMEWRQVLDLMWSDPKPQKGCHPNTTRGGGCFFGPDTSANFLTQNNLSMLVRSHECQSMGFEFSHGGTVLTIFSASNYYSDGSNLGAYVKFDNDGQSRISQFSARKANLLPLGRQLLCVEDRALRSLRAKIAAAKSELMNAFDRLDPGKTGCVSVAHWCGVMEAELKLSLPWRRLRPHLAQLTPDGRLMYMSTFQRAMVERHVKSGRATTTPDASMTEAMYKNMEELETIFRIMDRDSNGHISLDEFKECCRILGQTTKRNLSDVEIVEMAKDLDINDDGKIDFNEFLEAFRIVEFQRT